MDTPTDLTPGASVLVHGRMEAVVVSLSSDGRNVQVRKADGSTTWTRTANVRTQA